MEKTQIEQGIRLKALIKTLALTQLEFAQSLGMSQPNISRMVSGRNNISMEALNGISSRYKQVNLHWLLTGDGEMFLEESTKMSSEVHEDAAPYKRRLEELKEGVEQMEKLIKRLKSNSLDNEK